MEVRQAVESEEDYAHGIEQADRGLEGQFRWNLASAAIRLLEWMWNEAKTNQSMAAASQLLDLAAGRVIPICYEILSR